MPRTLLKPLLKPDFYFDSVFQVPYDRLYEQGVRGLIFDIDNTLASHADKRPHSKTVALVKRLKKMGFHIGLLSNNSAKRLEAFNEVMQLPGASMAAKPFTPALRRLMQEMKVSSEETAIIGDQLFADIWCGKRVGITTVLVKPITEKEVITARIKRGLERRMLKRYYEPGV